MRNIAIFAGGVHTMGLGLEIELRPKYNDDKWLLENGLTLPLPREDDDVKYWKENRFSKLVCDKLNLIEYNTNDEFEVGKNAIDTLWFINRDKKRFKDILDNTKYIFLEIGFIKSWNNNIGMFDNYTFPNDISDIIDFINNPLSDFNLSSLTLDWLCKTNESVFWNETFKIYEKLKLENPEITFYIIPWSMNYDNKELVEKITPSIKNDFIFFDIYRSMMDYMNEKKLNVWNVSKAYNGNFKYNYRDLHPSVEGHKQITEFILKRIKIKDEN